MSNFNPYDPSRSAIDPLATYVDGSARLLSAPDVKKEEAVIKDANQFWLAALASIFCSIFGVILIVPWYSVRLVQWGNLSRKYPILLTPNSPQNSLADRFRESKWKLLTAIVFGLFILGAIVSFVLLSVFTDFVPDQR